MTIASQPRRSWRRLTRIIIIFSVSLVCLYYYNRPQNDTSTLKVDKKTQPGPKAKSDTSTPLPKAKRPPPGPPPEPRYQWTELWEAKPDGKLVVPIDESGKAVPKTGFARHPLLDLVEEGEKRWEERLQRQSKTLDEAVREYVRRYGRRPPKGFDAWFWYASERGVKLVDEFDAIDRDIKPFLALAPKHIRERLASAAKLQDTYHIKIVDGYADIAAAADFEEQFKAQDLVELISEFAEFLPNMDIHASKHDMGPNIFGDDFRAEVERLISQRDFMSAKNLTRFEWKGRNDRFGLNKACLDDAPAVLEEERGPVQPANETFEFIYSHGKTYDFCQNPSILRNNGIFSISHARESQVLPLFVQCKLRQGGDLQYPSLVQWQDPPLRGTMIPWRERPNSKLFWRGRMTGAHYNKQYGWRHTHRFRLHELAWNKTFADDEVAVLVEEDRKGQKGLRKRVFKRKELNDALLDVGLVGGVFQCDGEDGTCAEIEKSIKTLDPLFGGGNLAKYSLDVDGNGWSGRYQGLLASGSVVLKATVFPEWISDWLIPYYHYVPIQHDYSDLYPTMAFLEGYPETSADGKKKKTTTTKLVGGHEEIAERIAQHAWDAGQTLWRWEDMQAYMFRLLLEYARAMSPDREAMTFKPKEEGNF